MSRLEKLRKNLDENAPFYAYSLGVVIGSVATYVTIKSQLPLIAAHGYNLAMTDVESMLRNGVDLQSYFDSVGQTKNLIKK